MGVQSILMGVLAEMVMRTYYESQSKTTYLLGELRQGKPPTGSKHVGLTDRIPPVGQASRVPSSTLSGWQAGRCPRCPAFHLGRSSRLAAIRLAGKGFGPVELIEILRHQQRSP